MDAFESAVRDGMRMVEEGDCDGFNVGFNYGKAAGQTVGWPHVHLIHETYWRYGRPHRRRSSRYS